MRWWSFLLLGVVSIVAAWFASESWACQCRSACWQAGQARGQLEWSVWMEEKNRPSPPCQCIGMDGEGLPLEMVAPRRHLL